VTALYRPVLWQYLTVANWEVRRNAVAILSVAFPLVTPSASAAEHDEELRMQFSALQQAMRDPSECVRKAAVLGSCRILHRFWEMIPVEHSAALLSLVVEPVSPIGACEGLRLLVTNPFSHGVLGELMPKLGFLLHDNSPKVVHAFVSMMMAVSTSGQQISCLSIASQERLLCRLAELSVKRHRRPVAAWQQVAKGIVRLLEPSIYDASIPDQLKIAQYLVCTYPTAFVAMCELSAAGAAEKLRFASVLVQACYRKFMNELKDADEICCRVILRSAAALLRCLPTEEIPGKTQAFIEANIRDEQLIAFSGTTMIAEVVSCCTALDVERFPEIAGVVKSIDLLALKPGSAVRLLSAACWCNCLADKWVKLHEPLCALAEPTASEESISRCGDALQIMFDALKNVHLREQLKKLGHDTGKTAELLPILICSVTQPCDGKAKRSTSISPMWEVAKGAVSILPLWFRVVGRWVLTMKDSPGVEDYWRCLEELGAEGLGKKLDAFVIEVQGQCDDDDIPWWVDVQADASVAVQVCCSALEAITARCSLGGSSETIMPLLRNLWRWTNLAELLCDNEVAKAAWRSTRSLVTQLWVGCDVNATMCVDVVRLALEHVSVKRPSEEDLRELLGFSVISFDSRPEFQEVVTDVLGGRFHPRVFSSLQMVSCRAQITRERVPLPEELASSSQLPCTQLQDPDAVDPPSHVSASSEEDRPSSEPAIVSEVLDPES